MTPIDSSYVSEFSKDQVKEKEWSILDLCAYDAFTLFVSQEGAKHWKGLIGGVKEALPKRFKINFAVVDEDFELVEGEKGSEWMKGTGLASGGTILVRPDQHILAVLERADESIVVAALKSHLGL